MRRPRKRAQLRFSMLARCGVILRYGIGLTLAWYLMAGALRAGEMARIGAEDMLTIQAQDVIEIPDRPVRVDKNGFIDLPLVGRLEAAGKTTPELAALITERLQRFVRDPHVAVAITEYHSAPVSVLGEVNTPGVYQLAGPKLLTEMISLAGGLKPDAGATVEITREIAVGPLDILGAKPDETGRFTTVRVNIDDLTSGKSPALNIQMMPHDVVSVPKADCVYVMGEVKKAGGFTLKANEKMTVLQALALAEGMERTASPSKATILRISPETGERTKIPVDISKIIASREEDVRLRSQDIVVIPNNGARSIALRATEMALQVATGVAIYRH